MLQHSRAQRSYSNPSERHKATRDAYRDAGMCVSCGDDVKEGVTDRGKPYQTCQYCYKQRTKAEKQYRGKSRRPEIIDAPNTTTGAHYLVTATGAVGKIMPCNCDDPVILEFKGGVLDFFRLNSIELTKDAVTAPAKRKRRINDRYKTLHNKTIDKFIRIHTFLMNQTQPVRRSVIERVMGFDCARHLMIYPSNPERWNLETAGIVKRVQVGEKLCLWYLTPFGKKQGVGIIQSLSRDANGQ